MEIDFIINKTNIKRIGLRFKDIEYIYVYDIDQNMISLFSGTNLIDAYKDLINKNERDCIECKLSMQISKGISKKLDEIVEFDLEMAKANEIIDEMNKKLNQNFPKF